MAKPKKASPSQRLAAQPRARTTKAEALGMSAYASKADRAADVEEQSAKPKKASPSQRLAAQPRARTTKAEALGMKASPSQRLATQRPRAKTADIDAWDDCVEEGARLSAAPQIVTPSVGVAMTGEQKTTLVRIRSKWLVVDKREVPELVQETISGAPRTRWIVRMTAVYEALSILHGQATVQGCADNRQFGMGVPEAELVMKIDSKAIADAYQVGRAFVQDHVEVQAELRPLW